MEESHVLLFSFPAQGHVTPILGLAELLSRSGLLVTVLNTEHIHRRLLNHSSAVTRLSEKPNFRFLTIPDGLPEDDPRLGVNFLRLEASMRTKSNERYKQLLREESGGWPPVTCVVADGLLRLALEGAEEAGVPAIVFRTSSSYSFWVYYNIRKLIELGEIPMPDGADLDELVRGVEGLEGIVRRRDLPSFVREKKTLDDPMLQAIISISDTSIRAKALILNTFESLDANLLPLLRSHFPSPIYTIGPLHVSASTDTNNSLWHEERGCTAWLDAQPNKSVVYVSFGSITIVSREELLEFWHGLVDSGHRFLWVVRKDMVVGGEGETGVPEELEEGTRERGCMVAWAPQRQVLEHAAVGCFLTHSGWNSTMEGLVAGVPMICWPFFADQLINSRFVSEVWKVGLDMKDRCQREVVEKMIKEVMQGERAHELKSSALEMAEMARRSVEVGGTSHVNLKRLVQFIKSFH